MGYSQERSWADKGNVGGEWTTMVRLNAVREIRKAVELLATGLAGAVGGFCYRLGASDGPLEAAAMRRDH